MKKIILLIILTSSAVFADIGFFSFGYLLNFGGSLPSYYTVSEEILHKNINKTESSFEIGFLVQPSYNFIFNNRLFILGLGIDFGYYRDTYSFINNNDRKKYTHVFDSLNIGLYAEALFYNIFMIGFGSGIKIPLGGSYRYDNIIEMLNYNRLKDRFNNILIPYIKLLIGIKRGSVSINFYVNYDFPFIMDISSYYNSIKLSSIDLGVQIGFYIY